LYLSPPPPEPISTPALPEIPMSQSLTNKPKLLITEPEVRLNEQQLAKLRELAVLVTPENWDEDSLVAAAEGIDYIAHSFFPTISARLIETSDSLKAMVKYGVGTDNVDIPAATKRGVMVVNCPEYGTDTVADHAFALLISLARQIPQINRATQETGWVWPAEKFLGFDLKGKTVGIFGFGRIGKAVARRCAGFGMNLIFCDPDQQEISVAHQRVKKVSFEELCEQSDFISIQSTLTPTSRGRFDEAAFGRMKKSAFLIDVSRGAILVEEALVKALDEGRLAGAGLDVFPIEPLPKDFPLYGRDNVLLTSHLAWYTLEADARLAQECMDRLMELLEGKQPRNLVNAKELGMTPRD